MSSPPTAPSSDLDPALAGNVIVWTMAAASGAFLGFRLYIRQTRLQIWWDDTVLVGGWVLTIAQTAIFTEMLRRGFAQTATNECTVLLLILVGDTLQKLALSLTKLSFSLTLLRIFASGWQKRVILVLLLVINTYFLAHLALVWLTTCGCPHHVPIIPTSCLSPTEALTMQIIGAFLSAISDFILAFLPWTRVMEVNMKPAEKKAVAAITMSVGVIAGLAGIVKGIQGIKLLDFESPRYLHYIWVFNIVALVEPNATVIASSIPILRAFFRNRFSAYPQAMGRYIESPSVDKFPDVVPQPLGGNKRQQRGSATFISVHNAAHEGREEGGLDNAGILRTRTVAVTYDNSTSRGGGGGGGGGGSPRPESQVIELQLRTAPGQS